MSEDSFLFRSKIMNFKAMNMFLSEENIKRHLEHLRTMKLKYSILEKSLPELKGRSIAQIVRLGINRKLKDEAINPSASM